MVHHNVVHLPEQSRHELGRRYSWSYAAAPRLWGTGVYRGICVQDLLTVKVFTISPPALLVSYPHPYRVLQLHQDDQGRNWFAD